MRCSSRISLAASFSQSVWSACQSCHGIDMYACSYWSAMLAPDLFLDMPQQRAYRCWQRLIGGTPGHEDIAGDTTKKAPPFGSGSLESLGLKAQGSAPRGSFWSLWQSSWPRDRGQRLQCLSASQAA